MKRKVPNYVHEARKKPLSYSILSFLKTADLNQKLRGHCFNKEKALEILEDFAKVHRYGVLPDKLVCYRIFVDHEDQKGELGLTYVPVYRVWEFYAKGLDKHSRPVHNFKVHLEQYGFKLKMI